MWEDVTVISTLALTYHVNKKIFDKELGMTVIVIITSTIVPTDQGLADHGSAIRRPLAAINCEHAIAGSPPELTFTVCASLYGCMILLRMHMYMMTCIIAYVYAS